MIEFWHRHVFRIANWGALIPLAIIALLNVIELCMVVGQGHLPLVCACMDEGLFRTSYPVYVAYLVSSLILCALGIAPPQRNRFGGAAAGVRWLVLVLLIVAVGMETP